MFAEKLKELRKNKGLTQIAFAQQFDIATGTIGMWETGKREPDYEMIVKIAEYFNVSVDYLLGREKNELDEQLEGVNFALFTETKELTDENKKDVLEFIRYKKSQQRSE